MPLDDTQKPANSPANQKDTSASAGHALLMDLVNELAAEAGISNDKKTVENLVSKLRWYPRGNPPAVVIVKRGNDRKVLATISPKHGRFAHLYPSWRDVLIQLASEKAALRVSRLSHEGLEMGEVPVV